MSAMAAFDPETTRKLRCMGCPELADALEGIWRDPAFAAVAPEDRLAAAVDRAYEVQGDASTRARAKRAHLRDPQADIARIVYEGRPALSRDQILSLGTCAFMETRTDVIVEGFAGTGKTFLGCALAKQACRHGRRALCVRLPDLLMAYEEWKAAGRPEEKFFRKYARYDLLAIDEWLIDELGHAQARVILEIVDRRYDRASNVICTQYPKDEWCRRLGGGATADAVVDRIVQNSVTINTGEANMRELTSPTRKPAV